MLEFERDLIYTGMEEKISKKGNKYVVIHLLDANGKAFSCMYENGHDPSELNVSGPPFIPKQLDRIRVQFRLKLGKFMNLSILNIAKIA